LSHCGHRVASIEASLSFTPNGRVVMELKFPLEISHSSFEFIVRK